jgi:hypothetical protein
VPEHPQQSITQQGIGEICPNILGKKEWKLKSIFGQEMFYQYMVDNKVRELATMCFLW